MGELFNRLIESIPSVDSSSSLGPRSVQSESYRPKFEEKDGEDLEIIFNELEHEFRLKLIREKMLSSEKWREFSVYIQSDEELEFKWGRKGKHENEGNCIEHNTSLTTKTIYDQSGSSYTDSRTHGVNLSSGVNVGPKIETSIEGMEGTQESERSITGDEKELLECPTGDKDCIINRRSFLNAGDFWMITGISRNELFEEFNRRCEEVDAIDSKDEDETE